MFIVAALVWFAVRVEEGTGTARPVSPVVPIWWLIENIDLINTLQSASPHNGRQ